jgi:hypothetical protein
MDFPWPEAPLNRLRRKLYGLEADRAKENRRLPAKPEVYPRLIKVSWAMEKSPNGAKGVNTKITILQVVALAQGKTRRILLHPLIAIFGSGENNTTSRGG